MTDRGAQPIRRVACHESVTHPESLVNAPVPPELLLKQLRKKPRGSKADRRIHGYAYIYLESTDCRGL
jgi:hypothetical protein